MEDTEKNERRFWTKKRKIKAAVWLAVILVIALGFAHQYFIHTDGYIKSYIEKNKTELTQAAEGMLDKPTTSDSFINSVQTQENRITKDSKINIGLLIDNPFYKDMRGELKKVDSLGIQDVKATSETVRFYHSSRYVVIYSPDKDEITGAVPAGDGWFYIKSF